MPDKLKKVLSTALKFLVSGLAIWFVFKSIDWIETKSIFYSVEFHWLLLAILFFVISKILSALRLNYYFREISIKISEKYNLKLAWIGMFYNLFLPGGIGGDGYKVYLLHKRSGISVKLLAAGALIDRLSGMVALCALACLGAFWLDLEQVPLWVNYLALLGALLAFPVFRLIKARFFKSFTDHFFRTSAYSLATQGMQVLCAYFILLALGVSGQYLEYQVLFLVSSVVAVLPFTIGGVGARELTFILGHDILLIEAECQLSGFRFSQV